MKEDWLDHLREIYRLKRISSGRAGLNLGRLERDFLEFSTYNPEKTLTVRMPRMYNLHGDERQHYADVLEKLGAARDVPNAIDISGAHDHQSSLDVVVFVSLAQLNADHVAHVRSYLNPLLEVAYGEGGLTMRDFSIHEALYGRVAAKRGDLDLAEARLFPSRFTKGPYTLRVELDTPNNTLRRLRDLAERLKEIKASPKKILDHDAVNTAASEGVALREKLGALSRYQIPKARVFEVQTDSCVMRTENSTLFYLYSRGKNKNVLVYFGERPFREGHEPAAGELCILDGDQNQHTLAALVRAGIFKPNASVLRQRIENLKQHYDNAIRAGIAEEAYMDFKDLLAELENAYEYLDAIVNPEMQVENVLRRPPEILEFLVCPTTEDPVVHELLPRVSWNKAVRLYNNTRRFIAEFEKRDDAGRKALLNEAASNIIFTSNQNNDVNVWLYQNHRDTCRDAGIKFKVLE